MDLKKKNTDVDEIKEKLKKYYKLYVSINYIFILYVTLALIIYSAKNGLCKLSNKFVCSQMLEMWFDS